MNVNLAKKILKWTPKHILHPSPSIDTALPLSTGATIPALGLALWKAGSEVDEVKDKVLLAIKAGYRYFDVASESEAEVGRAVTEAIEKGSVKRDEVFIAIRSTIDEAETTLASSLKTLALEYVDLVILEGSASSIAKSWQSTTDCLLSKSKARATGLSNLNLTSLEELLSTSKSIPTVLQSPSNPYTPQNELIGFCADKSIHVTATSPIHDSEKGWLFKHPAVIGVSEKHNVVPENVLLSWHLARGCSVLVEDVILGGSKENRKLVQLDGEDMEVLGAIGE